MNRRAFLRLGAYTGAGAITGLSTGCSGNYVEQPVVTTTQHGDVFLTRGEVPVLKIKVGTDTNLLNIYRNEVGDWGSPFKPTCEMENDSGRSGGDSRHIWMRSNRRGVYYRFDVLNIFKRTNSDSIHLAGGGPNEYTVIRAGEEINVPDFNGDGSITSGMWRSTIGEQAGKLILEGMRDIKTDKLVVSSKIVEYNPSK